MTMTMIFVKDNWNRDPYDCKMDKHQIGKGGTVLHEHERRICRLSAGTQYNSTRRLTQRIMSARGDEARKVHHTTMYRYMKSIELIPFVVQKKPFKNE